MTNQEIKPFWNSKIKEYSSNLWLPDKRNLDIDNDFLTNYSNIKNEKKITSLNKKILNEPIITDKEILKTRKIILYPNKEQIYFLKQLFGSYRYTYNKTIHHIKENPPTYEIKNDKKIYNLPNYRVLRVEIVKNQKHDEWFYKLPDNFLNDAVEEACFNFNQNIFKGKKFSMKFKSKKEPTETIKLYKKSFIKGKNLFFPIFFNRFRKEFFRKTTKIKDEKQIKKLLKQMTQKNIKEI